MIRTAFLNPVQVPLPSYNFCCMASCISLIFFLFLWMCDKLCLKACIYFYFKERFMFTVMPFGRLPDSERPTYTSFIQLCSSGSRALLKGPRVAGFREKCPVSEKNVWEKSLNSEKNVNILRKNVRIPSKQSGLCEKRAKFWEKCSVVRKKPEVTFSMTFDEFTPLRKMTSVFLSPPTFY